MPILNCYVDDRTLAILQREAKRRGMDETPERLAENAIAEAALLSVPPHLRNNVYDVPLQGHCGSK